MKRVLALSTIVVAGCGPQDTGMSLFSEGAGERTLQFPFYDTLWTYGGANDTLLVTPGPMAAARDGGVYVLDLTTHQIHKFSAAGSIVWSWGQIGEGPGEVRNARAMTSASGGGVVLADSDNRRLVYLSKDGRLEREVPLRDPAFGVAEGIAALADGSIVLDTDASNPWIVVSSADGSGEAVPAPWGGFREMSYLQRTGVISGAGGTRWVFGFMAGNGFYVMDGKNAEGVHPYVEHSEFPAVVVSRPARGVTTTRLATRPSYSAYDLTTKGDTLLVLAGGTTRLRRRVIDKYDLDAGGYLGSQMLPVWARRFAVSGDTVFLATTQAELFPLVMSLHYKGEPR